MVRTRFAPSPTGYLHIGGVRTALFNWLFARRHEGRFILRIDDTDQERNVEEALVPILRGFRWLAIDWDEGPEVGGDYGPYYQSQRRHLHQEAVRELVSRGLAYFDYATPEELRIEREAAQAEGRRFIYSRRWMADSPEKRERFAKEGRPGVVRLKMPREGSCSFGDLVRGPMELEWAREQDHVIQRADGTCLYHLASVVDDHEMRISHVIRAEEHLSNTPRQIFIARGLGYELPQYAHLPYVAEPASKSKLSKRKLDKYLKNPEFAKLSEHGERIAEAIGLRTSPEAFNPVVVDFYQEVGYLADAIVNYLLLLGWSLDDRTEFFTRREMIDSFSLERVNRAPASLDPLKLSAFQLHYMQAVSVEEKTVLTLPYLERAALVTSPVSGDLRDRLARVVAAAGDRIKVAGDILDFPDFFLPDDELAYEAKAWEKWILKPADVAGLLGRFKEKLSEGDPADEESWDRLIQDFVASEEARAGQVVQALRVAVTGKAVGFGLSASLAILGKGSCLRRLDRAISSL